jgi:oligoendopeptidase F
VPTELPFETLIQRCSDLDEEKRTRAAEQINTLLTPLADVAENELNSILEYKKETDTLRNFSYPEEETYLRDDIDKEVVDAMATAVVQSFSFSQQFYTFKAQLLGKSQLTYAEKNIKYGHVDKTYTFDEAVDLVYETVQALDPEF